MDCTRLKVRTYEKHSLLLEICAFGRQSLQMLRALLQLLTLYGN